MKAFVLSLVALAVITAAAAAGLQIFPSSSSHVFSEKPNVRL